LTFLSGILFAAVALVLARVVRERMPRLAMLGGCLGVVGAFGLASVGVASMTDSQIAQAPERDAMISLMDRLYDADQSGVFITASGPVGSVIVGSALIATVGLGWLAASRWRRGIGDADAEYPTGE
jgi:hypothetical protein